MQFDDEIKVHDDADGQLIQMEVDDDSQEVVDRPT